MLPVIQLYHYPPSSSKSFVNLQPGEIHIWKIACSDHLLSKTELDTLHALLLAEEADRASQFAHPQDRLHYTLGHTALRTLLSLYTGCPRERIHIASGTHGKPYWAAPPPYPSVEFNLSHSGDWILLAFSLDHILGVDTEKIDSEKKLERMVQRFYHPCEIRKYQNTPECQKAPLFFCCWTIKEAYLKGLGEGLLHPTNEFYVNLTGWEQPDTVYTIYSNSDQPTAWRAQHIPVSEEYVGTIAYSPLPRAAFEG